VNAPRTALAAGLALVALGLDLGLLAPLLTVSEVARQQTQRVYYEPDPDGGVGIMIDGQQGGYVTDVAVDAQGRLEIPAGRTIAVPLAPGDTLTVRTEAADLAPYVVVATEVRRQPIHAQAEVHDATVVQARDAALAPVAWDATRPWAADRDWLRALAAHCRLAPPGEATLRAEAGGVAIRIGACSGFLPAAPGASRPLLLIATGPHAALASRTPGGWAQTTAVQWPLVGVALLRLALLVFALGAGPTAMLAATLFAAGLWSQPEAILTWFITLPCVIAAAVGRLIARRAPRRRGLIWAGAVIVLVLQLAAMVAAVAEFDVGTFGKERITRAGDDGCAIVGYSTVRGDALRWGTDGLVERLNQSCDRCRNRTARFSREAQTLRWVHEEVCAPEFPAAAGGDVVFVGGGNDDLFYRPSRLSQLLGDFLTVVRTTLRPISATEWATVFGHASERAVATIDEQSADIRAIGACATARGRRLHFVHDFLIWDLEGGRTAPRQQTFAARRAAVQSAGGEFIDLYAEFGQRAGVAWFNDFIHPSGLGHQMIADLLCARLAPAGG
jgi:hypothetical protein